MIIMSRTAEMSGPEEKSSCVPPQQTLSPVFSWERTRSLPDSTWSFVLWQLEQNEVDTSLPLTCWWASRAPFRLFALNASQGIGVAECSWSPRAQTTSAKYLGNIKSQISRVRVIKGTARARVTLSKKLYVNKERHPGIKCFTCWFLHGIWMLAAGTSIIPMELHLSNFSGNYLEAAWYQSKKKE